MVMKTIPVGGQPNHKKTAREKLNQPKNDKEDHGLKSEDC